MKHYTDDMPLYAAGQLSPAESEKIEKHLKECAECRSELYFWQTLSTEIRVETITASAPLNLADRALDQIRSEDESLRDSMQQSFLQRVKATCLNVFNLLRAQAYLVRREIWPVSASIMALGIAVGLLSNHAEVISFFVPLVAAASLAVLSGSEYDPAYELVLATPTSAWKILLARLSVVSVYDLLLSLVASLAMLLIVPPGLLGMIILGWLAPMAFLSALALLLSLWIGTSKSLAVSYILWIMQYLKLSAVMGSQGILKGWDAFVTRYSEFWQTPGLMLVFAAVLLGIALLSTRFTDRGLRPTLS